LSKIKRSILEELWKENASVNVAHLSKILGLKYQVIVMNLNELEKLGYVVSKQRGYYSITPSGREALGFPILTPQLAQRILYPRRKEEAFHFFTGIGNYTGVFASSLQEFFEKIQTIDEQSIKFHLLRGDFEKWFEFLGDRELAKRVSLLRERANEEKLRETLYNLIKIRCAEISAALK